MTFHKCYSYKNWKASFHWSKFKIMQGHSKMTSKRCTSDRNVNRRRGGVQSDCFKDIVKLLLMQVFGWLSWSHSQFNPELDLWVERHFYKDTAALTIVLGACSVNRGIILFNRPKNTKQTNNSGVRNKHCKQVRSTSLLLGYGYPWVWILM